MKIGALVSFRTGTDIWTEFRKLKDLELECCQLCCWDTAVYTRENAESIRLAAATLGIEVTAVWAGWSGPAVWNFVDGPETLGLVPPAYRFQRLRELEAGSDFAEMLGVTDVITHAGFLPENPHDTNFVGTVSALRTLTQKMKQRGQYFLFETGQETPVTVLRAIETIGTGNLGVNLDTANLILYGKANTADALDVFGKYVRNTHCKDGLYPTTGTELGQEVALGDGKADMPLVVKKLRELGYQGPLVIEREISGEEQTRDIVKARDLLRGILQDLEA